MARTLLKEYWKKRDFGVTAEPSGKKNPSKPAAQKHVLSYVIQKHRASHLHYDFRLEWGGTLLSWAVPKGPSLDPTIKRLAMQVEDHPIEYAKFEGIIPEGQYGGGTVMVWDRGTWLPESPDVEAALKKGDFKFQLFGEKLKGSWVLVRTRSWNGSSKPAWLLIKHHDAYAKSTDITLAKPYSILSKRLLVEIARINGGNLAKAASGDPPELALKALRKTPHKNAGGKKSVWHSHAG
jgi:bifunctional non-homologous end joining protein LigD